MTTPNVFKDVRKQVSTLKNLKLSIFFDLVILRPSPMEAITNADKDV